MPYMEGGLPGLVSSWVADAGLSAAAVARRSGVSASTVHRVLNGKVDPSLGTVREIGLACGVDVLVESRPLADWAAAAAARVLLEDGYVPAEHPAVAAWVERLPRLAGSHDPIELVTEAGRASSPASRRDAHLYRGTATVGRAASAGHASGGRWALSGALGLRPSDVRPGLALPATTILWCDHPRTVAQLLADDAGLKPARDPHGAALVVVGGDDGIYHDTFTQGIATFAAPIQIVMDCISLGGATAEQATKEARSW